LILSAGKKRGGNKKLDLHGAPGHLKKDTPRLECPKAGRRKNRVSRNRGLIPVRHGTHQKRSGKGKSDVKKEKPSRDANWKEKVAHNPKGAKWGMKTNVRGGQDSKNGTKGTQCVPFGVRSGRKTSDREGTAKGGGKPVTLQWGGDVAHAERGKDKKKVGALGRGGEKKRYTA